MIHPDTCVQFISSQKGLGVVATKHIPRGTVMWVNDELDRIFTPQEIAEKHDFYQALLNTYCFVDHKGNYVLCWDNERYINHSFNANVLTTAYDFTIAVKDIYPNEEITNDYGTLNLKHPIDFVPEPNNLARTTVSPNDLIKYSQKWDVLLLNALQLFKKVKQPLDFLLKPEILTKVDAINNGLAQMDSISNCYHDSTS